LTQEHTCANFYVPDFVNNESERERVLLF